MKAAAIVVAVLMLFGCGSDKALQRAKEAQEAAETAREEAEEAKEAADAAQAEAEDARVTAEYAREVYYSRGYSDAADDAKEGLDRVQTAIEDIRRDHLKSDKENASAAVENEKSDLEGEGRARSSLAAPSGLRCTREVTWSCLNSRKSWRPSGVNSLGATSPKPRSSSRSVERQRRTRKGCATSSGVCRTPAVSCPPSTHRSCS